MTPSQVKAAASLKRALTKCAKADLSVLAMTDVGFFVVPISVLHTEPEGWDAAATQDWYEQNGINCDVHNLSFDGGAGV